LNFWFSNRESIELHSIRERERESKLSLRYKVPDLTASNFWFSNRESVPLHGMRERSIFLSHMDGTEDKSAL